jgi:hypothetical protein
VAALQLNPRFVPNNCSRGPNDQPRQADLSTLRNRRNTPSDPIAIDRNAGTHFILVRSSGRNLTRPQVEDFEVAIGGPRSMIV